MWHPDDRGQHGHHGPALSRRIPGWGGAALDAGRWPPRCR
ncbi:hypothetical protein I551_2331 [Mycobacterium ulcerans str. Harvey]|uniref:Uncharacterized protein n=1 Tax=Mycobacterium ulcerans str. Harvey TaxID=1299332 RepID=A0ABN0R271_MYCUL|nr:hypothetical protein I551_2331 [Mycobacterium ulcerans str. Harvey]